METLTVHPKPLGSASVGVAPGLTKTIASCYDNCSQGFIRLDSVLHSTAASELLASPEDVQQTQKKIHEQRARFKLWAGNAGAHRRDKMSLDHRLREALHIHSQVIQLLEDLEHALEEGT